MALPIPPFKSTPQVVNNSPALVVNPDLVMEMLFSTLVIYGPTGTRKTTQIGELAKYVYEKTGKKTRLLTADGGGYGPIQDLVNVGIIDVWRVTEEQNIKVAIIKASKGAWPDKIVNGLRASSTIKEILPNDRARAFKDIGAYAVEGFTSIAQAVMGDAVSKGDKISQDIVGKFTETTEYGSETFGAPSPSHYGWTQRYILDMIRNFSALPLERVMYTALEGKGEDKLTKALQYGPAVAGQAITASIPQYVGDCLHFEDYVKDLGKDPTNDKQKLVGPGVRGWFVQHPDSITNVMWPAKARLVPSKVQAFKDRMGAQGYFDLDNFNLGDYLRVQDEMLASSTDEIKAWKERIDAVRAASNK